MFSGKIHYFLAQVPSPKPTDFELPRVAADADNARTLVQLIIGVIAAMAVIVIIISAFNLVTGGGDPEKISRGKRGIIFALVGLTIAIFAEAIVLVVLGGL